MKKIISAFLACTAIFSSINVQVKADVILNDGMNLFVSADGKDTNSGTSITSSLKTIEKAQAKAKLYRNLGYEQVTIYLREGIYQPFVIESTNASGTEECKIVYESYPGEEAVITDGIYLDTSKFENVTDSEIKSRMNPNAVSNIKKYDLSGINGDWNLNKINYGQTISLGAMLYLDNETMNIARWPNEGYLTVNEMGKLNNAKSISITNNTVSGKIDNEPNLWLGGYYEYSWAYKTDKATSNNKTITISSENITDAARLYLFNGLSLLDAENEWYIENNTLYFYPPKDISSSKLLLATGSNNLIGIKGASYVTLKNLTLEGTRENGINIRNSNNINIENCTVRNITKNAMDLMEVYDSKISNNTVYNVGCAGVTLGQYEERMDLKPGNVEISNNEFYNFSQFVRCYTPAVSLSGVANLVKGNVIHDAPHNAIMFGLNDNIIEENDIYNVMYETDDVGAIYTGKSWAQAGNIIRNNKIHDCVSYDGATIMGIYLDDMYSNTTVTGNVIDGITVGILMGGGHFNTIENNIISNVKNRKGMLYSIYADDRGTKDWFAGAFSSEDHKVLSYCTFITELLQLQYLVNPAYDKYPKLRKILEKDYRQPQDDTIRNNISYKHERFRIENTVIKNGNVSNNIELEQNPGFKDEQNLDFSGVNLQELF